VTDHASTELRDHMQNTLADLAELTTDLRLIWAADPADTAAADQAAAKLDRLARELAEAASMARAITGHPRQAPAVPFIGRSALSGLLTAVITALEIPPPAGTEDETIFLRVRSQRAAEAARACRRVLDDKGATDLDLAWTGAWLDAMCRQLPADGYEHHPMGAS
jgi:hypothetical protein